MFCSNGYDRVLVTRWVAIYACVLFAASSNFLCQAWNPISDVRSNFDALQKNDPTVFGAAVAGMKAPGNYHLSVGIGLGAKSFVEKARPMTLDASFRTNVLSELFLDMAVTHMEYKGLLPFMRKGAIPKKYLPPPYKDGGTPFVNPRYPFSVVSLDTLLYHTSSLTEHGFISGSIAAPGPAMSLKVFIEAVFSTQDAKLWSDLSPGSVHSYLHSRLNVALATYVLDAVLNELNASMTTATLIHNEFFAPIGLIHTFLVDETGSFPAPGYPESAKTVLPARTVEDVAADGENRARGVILHAAYTADFMYYTSVMELVHLGRELFFNGGHLTYLGSLLLADPIKIQRGKLSSRALGLYLFDKKAICESTKSFCSLDSVGNVIGWAVQGTYNDVALFCLSKGCTAVEISHYERVTKNSNSTTDVEDIFSNETITKLLSLAVPSLQVIAGVLPPEIRQGGLLRPLYIFIGVLAAILLAVGGGFVADYIIQAPRPTRTLTMPDGGLPVNDFEEPPNNSLDAQNTSSRVNQSHGIASPVRRLDVYD